MELRDVHEEIDKLVAANDPRIMELLSSMGTDVSGIHNMLNLTWSMTGPYIESLLSEILWEQVPNHEYYEIEDHGDHPEPDPSDTFNGNPLSYAPDA